MRISALILISSLLGLPVYAQEEVEEVQISEDGLTARESHEFDKHFFEAQRFKAVGDDAKMLAELEACLELQPNHATVNFEIAQYYLKRKMAHQAATYLKLADENDPGNPWIVRAEWEAAKLKMNLVEERNALEKLHHLEPDNPEFIWELAMAKLRMNLPDSAIADLDKLDQLLGPSDMVMDQKVRIYLELGNLEGAEKVLVDAIATSPNRMDLRGRLAEFYENTGQRLKSIGVYEEIIRLDSNEPRAHLHIASLLSERGRLDSAAHHLRIALSSTELPIDAKMGVLVNLLAPAEKDPAVMKLALELGDTLVSVHPSDPKAYAMLADFAIRANQVERSRNLWKKAVMLPDGDKLMLWQQILQTDVQLQMWDSLHVDAQLVLERYPNQPLSYLYDGLALVQLEEYEDAILILEEGELYALGNPELESQFSLQLASAYEKTGDSEMAIAYFEKVLLKSPDNVLALNNYAYHLAERGVDLPNALSMASRATSLAPDQSTFWDTYAWVLYKMDRYSEALDKIDRAIRIGGARDSEILEHKGDILSALGRREEAIHQWNMALEKGGNEERLRQKIVLNE
ncbi:tetratricopeptide repeat protein [Phaeocystidibacter marisrubri]|uniref:Tetratricopeptide repeat protein n=1 Tax=Phaeocystidibacter marisrubri TaxID=1577780 RepID=A0A6L3ZD10_9FLAO|nr:tetratricopeptide repeat protein [Phaeocystidibacter marisrubri]KAB2815108.1 tetratricopeptide repeat protein [Phaeocystidibacter marisrubri]GGH70357.1 hypothetical protein GCM10011318_12280 [Phaeocystidibacter marisrubri]